MKPLAEATLLGIFKLIDGDPTHGLPDQVADYLEGRADEMPADLGWLPPTARNLLSVMRGAVEDRRHERERATAEALAELEAHALLQRIAQASKAAG